VKPGEDSNGWALFGQLLASILAVVTGVLTFVGLPLGVLFTTTGCAWFLLTLGRSNSVLLGGLWTLGIGVCGLVATGVLIRFMVWTESLNCL
jgi:hypothetical protein